MAGAVNALPLVAAIIGLGVGAQVLAARFQVPSIIFLLLAGVMLGPEGIGFITRNSFGTALPAIVGFSVAIIVFEGAFHLRIDRLREAPQATLRLITVGALVAFVGTSAAVWFFLGTTWEVAALIGALLVATGPTVISPILEVVPVRDRVATALETEGIVNDVTAAIMAVVVFEAVLLDEATVAGFLTAFAQRMGIGLFVGLVVAGVLWYLLWHVDLSPDNAPQNARLLVLAGAVVAFSIANEFASEAGVAAVATAGIVLGNIGVPYEENITEFKGDITLLVLSIVFITLAALLEFEDLITLGIPGLLVVVVVALVIRPLLVFVSTTGGDRFTMGERWFMSLVGPRGIIPASVATLFAVELQSGPHANPEAAATLVGTVFLVIFATVVFEGGFARYIAEYLDVIPMRVLIIGGGKVGRSLADRLEDRGENVVIIERDGDVVEKNRSAGHKAVRGDGTDTDVLREAGAANAKIVVAATGDDDANLLVAQLADSKFSVPKVIARANNPDNVEAFEDLGVSTISSAMATAWAIDNQIERPTLANWMTDFGDNGDVQEIEVTSDRFAGRTVREVGPELPEGCLIALVSKDGDTKVPTADYVIELGDKLTLLGQRDSVRSGMEMCNSD
ncbi:cation:proton antiporter [Haloarculaceae archaeon H-GB2-1]|nr:NAD-binding protein [Haloarculaceae archaeon H-GB1-1]MEA5407155.1 cation:proton antiporter [Haloarculaceae archaeon H-GB2-1]